MPDRMQKFVSVAGAMPDKRPADARRKDFDEIYDEYSTEAAARQASRCEQCGIPYCQVHCPLQNNIPDWLRLTDWRGQPAGELWAYDWRGQHDQLLFAVEGEQVRAAGWLLMYE